MLAPVFPLLRVHAEMTFPESLSLEVLHAGPATPSNAPPLLFVHGAFCGAWIWQEHFLDWFAARGYDAYAVSLRGHGNSGSLNDLQRASMNDFVEDVSHVLTGLPRPPVLIGHSMGGMVVQRLIERNPLHTAAGAVLMSSVSPGGLWGTTLHMALNTPNILWTLAGMQTFGTQMASAEALHRALFPASVPLETTQKYLTRFQTESMRAQSDLTFSPPPVATPWQIDPDAGNRRFGRYVCPALDGPQHRPLLRCALSHSERHGPCHDAGAGLGTGCDHPPRLAGRHIPKLIPHIPGGPL